jgi:homocysteine S-methyltransferase
VYATHSSWNHVRWVAFETVPVLSEITAIRRAIAVLQTEGLWGGRRFWISSAFPGGKHGQRTADGTAVQSAEVLRTMLEDGEGCARPDGVGINCTNPQYIPILIADFDAAASTLASATTGTWHAPWLVVYPDGGAVYDVVAQTWTEVQHASPDQWAVELLRATEKVGALDIWAGAIVGGCCKSSFAEIAALRTAVGPK